MRRITLQPLLLSALLVVLPRPAPAAEDLTRLEKEAAKEAAKVVAVWLDLAGEMVAASHRTAAEEALASAKDLDPQAKGLADLVTRAEGLAEDLPLDAEAQKKVAKAKEAAAKGYDRLSKVYAKEPQDVHFAQHLLTAYTLDPSKARLVKIADLAKKDLFLMRCPAHPFAAYVSLPKDWKPGKEYPVLVSVEGAGSNFSGNASQFSSARGSRPFITIAAHALSCTNEIKYDKYPAYSKELINEWNNRRVDFDVAGLLALLDFLREHFGAAPKIAITGFSGGGNLCYGFLLRHPDRVLCAAPACANFNPGLAQGATKVEDGGPPVHVMTGEKDPHRDFTHGNKDSPGIEPQSDGAVKALEENGFTKVTRTMLPGVGHSPLPREVWEFVDGALEAR